MDVFYMQLTKGGFMNTTINEVLNFVSENEVKFVRLGFCDPFGVQKNISIMSDELSAAFSDGVSFEASAIRAFRNISQSDLLLFPDPSTLSILPWRPGPGRVIKFYCDIKNPDGTDFFGDSRNILKRVTKRCEEMGYISQIGAECEFYLFKTDDDGEPTKTPLDCGGYFDIAPVDKGENIRRDICLALAEIGLTPEASHHEQGPGQNGIDFMFNNSLEAADNLLTFKSAVKSIATRSGLFASFLPKPLPSEAGSGLHVNVSLNKGGRNIFSDDNGCSEVAQNFIAGVLKRIKEISLFLNPIANSYERLGENKAPKFISWSSQNRSQLIRIPAVVGKKVRMELRSPDPAINPYIAYALILSAGLEGIENSYELPASTDIDLYQADASITDNLEMLPANLREAIETAKSSDFVKTVIGEELLINYLNEKEKELDEDDSVIKEMHFSCI